MTKKKSKNKLTQARQLIKNCYESKDPCLDLGKCGITDLNELPELFECRHLETLILSNSWWNVEGSENSISKNTGPDNTLWSIPKHIRKLKNLSTLIACGEIGKKWGITNINFIEDLVTLENLNVEYNEVTQIDELRNLKTLRRLLLGSNQILDANVLESIRSLQHLKLRSNKIYDIGFLRNLIMLECLNITKNNISDASGFSAIKNCKKLKFLNIGANRLTDIYPLESLISIQNLDVSANKIVDIDVLKNLTELEFLDISENRIYNMAPLKNLFNLKGLNVSSNGVSDIDAVKDLKNLRSLAIGNNPISDFTPLQNLASLQHLVLSDSKIDDLTSLISLTNLKELHLRKCDIYDLSPLRVLTNLESLNLNSNRVHDISSLKDLTKLNSLDLRKNNLANIPLFIFNLNLKINFDEFASDGLALSGNPIESPPIEIIKQGRQSVLDWFEASKKKLNEIKIILIGDPKAGKTSILRMLKDGQFDPNEVQTDGINIEHIQFRDCKSFEEQTTLHHFTGHFWDFGGQEIMNATHQFFLTNRSVYVLVLDARKDSNVPAQIRQWVKRIKATGGNSAIIVVANQIDVNRGFGFSNEYELQQEFPQIKYFIRASCSTGEKIDELKTRLEELIPQAELFNTAVDERWITIKEILQEETKQKHFLDEERFIEICNKCGLIDKQGRKNAINFLHDLGLILHFEELDLSEYYVLDPYWITYGVYQILTSSYAGKEKGIVDMDKLDFIINEEEDKKESYHTSNYRRIYYHPNQRRFLVDILNQFKLCFYLSDKCRFIIPDLLDTNEPYDVTEPIRKANDNIRFVYEYEYLPKSIMPHIMVETHEILFRMWRTGCLLRGNECHALISNYQNRVSIIVAGPHKKKREFMAVIRHLVDTINQKLTDRPKMLIPLPDADAYADYDELMEREKDGEKHYTVYKPVKNRYEIAVLLEGVPTHDEIQAISQKLDSVLAHNQNVKSDLEMIIETQKSISVRLEDHYHYLVTANGNNAQYPELLEYIKQMTEEQRFQTSMEIMKCLALAFEHFGNNIDARLTEIYTDLKQTDDVQTRLTLSVPFINLLGINLETEFDIKSWATKMYNKYKLKIFKGIGATPPQQQIP